MFRDNDKSSVEARKAQHAAQSEAIQKRLQQIKNKIIVMSGKGGVGKSSVAAYLSVVLAQRGHRIGLMDVDLHGPSIARMLGLHAQVCTCGGKGNLLFRDYGKQVYTVYARSTRQGVRVHFHREGLPEDLQDDRDALARWILTAPFEEMLSVEQVSIPEPEPVRIMESIPCAFCGEGVMASRIRQRATKPACIPCYEKGLAVDPETLDELP